MSGLEGDATCHRLARTSRDERAEPSVVEPFVRWRCGLFSCLPLLIQQEDPRHVVATAYALGDLADDHSQITDMRKAPCLHAGLHAGTGLSLSLTPAGGVCRSDRR